MNLKFRSPILLAILTTLSVPQSASADDYALIVCGSQACTVVPNPAVVLSTSLHGARCCSTTKITGFKKAPATCGPLWVQGEDSNGDCMLEVDYDYASTDCVNQGAMLCTEDQYLTDCTKKARCNQNNIQLWSSSYVAPTPLPTEPPVNEPTPVQSTCDARFEFIEAQLDTMDGYNGEMAQSYEDMVGDYETMTQAYDARFEALEEKLEELAQDQEEKTNMILDFLQGIYLPSAMPSSSPVMTIPPVMPSTSPTEDPYPDCDVEYPSWVGDGMCDGGDYNSDECGFDGGDCDEFNENYPQCDAVVPFLIGDGACDGTGYNTEECGYDGGDCDWFNELYPGCDVPIVTYVGDGYCDYGDYNTPECGYDGGDC